MATHILLCALGVWNPQSIRWGPQGEAGKDFFKEDVGLLESTQDPAQQSSREKEGSAGGCHPGPPERQPRGADRGKRDDGS